MKAIYIHPQHEVRQEMVNMVRSDVFAMDVTDNYGKVYAERKLEELEQMMLMIS